MSLNALRYASLIAVLPPLVLLGCSDQTYPGRSGAQASSVTWCNTGTPPASTAWYGGRGPESQAQACVLAARAMPTTLLAQRLSLMQRGCDLEDTHCLSLAEEVEQAITAPASRNAVPGTMVEAVYRLCAADKPMQRGGVNSTPSICYIAAQIAKTLDNREYAHAFDTRACEEGESAGCGDLRAYFGEGDAVPGNAAIGLREAEKAAAPQDQAQAFTERRADQAAATQGLQQQNANRDNGFNQVPGAMAHGNADADSQDRLNFTTGTAPSENSSFAPSSAAPAAVSRPSSGGFLAPADGQATAQQVGAMCKTRCGREAGNFTSTIDQLGAYRAAACEEACMYNNLPPDWPGRDQYRAAAERNAQMVNQLGSGQ
jgi:hypothetical protein